MTVYAFSLSLSLQAMDIQFSTRLVHWPGGRSLGM